MIVHASDDHFREKYICRLYQEQQIFHVMPFPRDPSGYLTYPQTKRESRDERRALLKISSQKVYDKPEERNYGRRSLYTTWLPSIEVFLETIRDAIPVNVDKGHRSQVLPM